MKQMGNIDDDKIFNMILPKWNYILDRFEDYQHSLKC